MRGYEWRGNEVGWLLHWRSHEAETRLAAVVAGGLLTGCRAGGVADPAAAEGSSADREKMSLYTDGYNQLVGPNGLEDVYTSYVKEGVLHKPLTENISVNDGFLGESLKKFQLAQGLPGKVSPEMDAAGAAVVATLGPAFTRVQGLETYYTSKMYREDKMARGKSEDAAMLREFRAAIKAQEDFGAVLDKDARRRDDAMLAGLKANGQMLAYENKLALRQGGDLVKLVAPAKDLRDAALYMKGDAQVAALEATMVAERAELAKAEANKVRFSETMQKIPVNLAAMIGSYREVKAKHQTEDVQRMIAGYNRAVEAGNSAY